MKRKLFRARAGEVIPLPKFKLVLPNAVLDDVVLGHQLEVYEPFEVEWVVSR